MRSGWWLTDLVVAVQVARVLAHSELVTRPHGDHIALFRGTSDLFELASNFISDQTGPAAAEVAQQNRAIA